MSCAGRREYWRQIYARYQQASWQEKQRILDEFCANCGYNRKYAIRLLNGPGPMAKPPRRRGRRKVTYGPRLLAIVQAVWEAADYPWSVRLKALLPEWMPWIRARFRLSKQQEQELLRISARTLDQRLRPYKRKLRRRLYGRTKPGTLLKQQIPVKTDRWDVQVPGFAEIDLVAHAGNSGAGDFCYSLNLTDIHTGWTESRAVLGRSQEGVLKALEQIRQALPFPLRGIDSDNGSEFINAHLLHYCQTGSIQFTRGRPYKKDDNAHIEQKNWTHVRRLLGYVRYDSTAAQDAINDLYGKELRLFHNLFLPSVKLEKKERIGSRLRRHYQAPRTPWQRVLDWPGAEPARLAELRQQRQKLDPFQLASAIQAKLEEIFRLSREEAPLSVGQRRSADPGRERRERARSRKGRRHRLQLSPKLALKRARPALWK